MLMVSEMLRVARDPGHAQRVRGQSAARFGSDGSVPVVVWNTCLHCNMRCPHCYASATDRPSAHDLSTEDALRVVDQMADADVKVVIFSGGEPLLRHDLFDLIARTRERGMTPMLSTNGVLIDAETARRLADAGVKYVGISIDGLAAFNDSYRGLENGFERAREGLVHAKSAGMRTGLRITVTGQNADQVDDMIDVARECRADRFYASHLVYSGRGHRMAAHDLRPAETRELLLALFQRAEAMLDDEASPDVVTGSNDSDGPLLLRWVAERQGEQAAEAVQEMLALRGGNTAGEKLLAIDHRGRVHPDQFWPSMTLADLREESFSSALAHPFRAELRRREELLEGRCGACRYQSVCRGSHRERALARHGSTWAPDPACVLLDHEIAAVDTERTATHVAAGRTP